MERRHAGRRRLVLLCVLITLAPLVAERRAGRFPCGVGGVVVVAAALLATVPRAVTRLAAALAEPVAAGSAESTDSTGECR
ncbi:hypothetical protein [Actinosynnema sp. NPDC020468]|uniref:hypothetical protein n=1 Tax=Actinosynnema sp. NPDC020468 TaxID=3154488 RepID=UPI0033E8AE84